MFPTLTFHDGGFLGDDYWVIDNIGEFDEAGLFTPCIGSPSACDEWWPSDDDFSENDNGPGGSRQITGNFYIENSAGDNNRLAPAVWNNAPNTRSLMRLYAEEFYPVAISHSAGLLKTFVDTVCPPPIADFTVANPAPDCAPHTVEFRDASEGGSIDTWRWDFGDGSESTARNPAHVYTSPGTYIVTLSVSGDCGEDTRVIRDLVRILPGTPVFDENGVETARAEVTLATQIPEAKCRQINLGYRDPATINPDDYANREDEGVLLVPHAGERRYRLANPPRWA